MPYLRIIPNIVWNTSRVLFWSEKCFIRLFRQQGFWWQTGEKHISWGASRRRQSGRNLSTDEFFWYRLISKFVIHTNLVQMTKIKGIILMNLFPIFPYCKRSLFRSILFEEKIQRESITETKEFPKKISFLVNRRYLFQVDSRYIFEIFTFHVVPLSSWISQIRCFHICA